MDRVLDEARGYYTDDAAHGWEHARRVEGLAVRVARRADGEPDLDTVRAGAVLHDIGRRAEERGEIDEHASWGADEARRILRDLGYDGGTVDAVAGCVASHRHSTGPEPRTREACIVSDADDLDALGAVGVARTFAHGGGFDETVEHIRDKLLGLRDGMGTEAARELADEEGRHEAVVRFLDRLGSERGTLDG